MTSEDIDMARSTNSKLIFLAMLVLMAGIGLVFLSGSLAVLTPAIVLGSLLNHTFGASVIAHHDALTTFIIFFLIALGIVAIFVCWNFRLFSENQAKIPVRSVLLYLLTLAGSIYWYAEYFPRHPAQHAVQIILSTVSFILTTGLLISGLTQPRFITNLSFNLMLFIWLFYCAFPWYFGLT